MIATCGGGAKVDLLRRLGVDRVVNYREEKLRDVLKREFPRGIDLAYESVGVTFSPPRWTRWRPEGASSSSA